MNLSAVTGRFDPKSKFRNTLMFILWSLKVLVLINTRSMGHMFPTKVMLKTLDRPEDFPYTDYEHTLQQQLYQALCFIKTLLHKTK